MNLFGHDTSKEMQEDEGRACSRRRLLKSSATLVMGAAVGTLASCAPTAVPEAPPLPWKWGEIDPLEAGRRAYRLYFDPLRGGCGSGAYLSILGLLKENVG